MSEETPAEATGPTEHEPTDEFRARVRQLAKVKTAKGKIAKEMGLRLSEFERHYNDDWETGRDEAQSALLAKLLAQGMAGNANAAVKYLTLMGMAAPNRVELTGKDGGPIEHVDLSLLSDDELETYGRIAARAAGLDPDAIREAVGTKH